MRTAALAAALCGIAQAFIYDVNFALSKSAETVLQLTEVRRARGLLQLGPNLFRCVAAARPRLPPYVSSAAYVAASAQARTLRVGVTQSH